MGNTVYCYLAFLVGLLATICSIYWSLISQAPSKSVVTLTWNNQTDMTNNLASLGQPVVLLQTPFSRHIDAKHLLATLNDSNTLLPYKTSHYPLFLYHASDQPLAEYDTRERSYQDNIGTAKHLISSLFSPSPSPSPSPTSNNMFRYSTAELNLLNITLPAAVLDQLSFPPNRQSPVQTNYWMGGAGVTAHSHYDTSHNIHYVITGHKRFVLAPPSYYNRFNLYSCLHPLYRQTQMEMSEVQNISPITVDLLPGQALYLPPYWFHTVVTMETSLSVNIWSDSQDYLLMEDVLTSPIPLQSDWSLETLLHASKLFIDQLIDLSGFTPTFIRDTVLPRYDSILHHMTHDHKLASILSSGCGSDISEEDHAHIRHRSYATSELLIKMFDSSIRAINLSNYIEHILYTLLREQGTMYIPLFLKQCW